MKTLAIGAALLAGTLLLAGCHGADNEVVKVSEHEGCSTYRVNPGFFANYVYYTVCRSGERVSTTHRTTQSTGKATYTTDHQVDTVWK